MDSAPSSNGIYLRDTAQDLVKIIISGPFGVGKTTIVHTLSDIRPLQTEEEMTATGAAVDHLMGVKDKRTTTVGLDYGRLTLPDGLVLCLFGTPGQERFRPLWQDITRGALGALILADTRRIDDSYEVMDLIEEQGTPYAVAVNTFPDAPRFQPAHLRDVLDLEPRTPLVECDARDRRTSIAALLALAEHVVAPRKDAPYPSESSS